MTTGWTDGKPWEIAWGKLRWEGATRKRRQGGRTETVGKNLGSKLGWEGATRKRGHGGRTGNRGKEFGKSSVGREQYTEATTGWTDGKRWDIAWGEPRWEGATRKRGSDDRVDGRETVGGKGALEGSNTEAESRAVGTGFQDKLYQCDCAENCGPKTCQAVCKHCAMEHA